MKKIIITLCFFIYFFNSTNLFAQINSHGSITGIVLDRITGKPLFYANVFLANTTMGTASNEDGKFKIDNIPVGKYQLVASVIGYKLKKINIVIKGRISRNFTIKLMPVPLQGKPVEINASRPGSWQKNFKVFKDLLLGESEFSKQCKMLNTYVLNINYDQSTHKLFVKTKSPLHIENNALGYDIYLTIEEFEYQGVGFFKFKGIPRFVPKKTKNKTQKILWEKNRQRAYNGSLRHFLTSLASGNLSEEGFRIYKAKQIKDNLNPNKLYYAQKQIEIDSVVSNSDSPFIKSLFFKNFIKVLYVKEKESPLYRKFSKPRKFQTSWIMLDKCDTLKFNIFGNLWDPYKLKTYGYWAWERFSESLPFDYNPSQINRIHILNPISLKIDSVLSTRYFTGDSSNIYFLTSDYKYRTFLKNNECAKLTDLSYKSILNLNNVSLYDTLFNPIDLFVADSQSKSNIDLYNFWLKNDPTPATAKNEAFCQFVRRISEYREFLREKISPDKDPRIFIYLRFGKPFKRIKIPSVDLLPESEYWVYKNDSTKIIFDFLNKQGNYQLFSDSNDIFSCSVENKLGMLLDFIQSRTTVSSSYKNFFSLINEELASPNYQNIKLNEIFDKINSMFLSFYNSVKSRRKFLPFFTYNPTDKMEVAVKNYTVPFTDKQISNIFICIPCFQLGTVQTDTCFYSPLEISYSYFNSKNNLIFRKKIKGNLEISDQFGKFSSLGFSVFSDTVNSGKYFVYFQVKDLISNNVWNSEKIIVGTPRQDVLKKKIFLSRIIPVLKFSDNRTMPFPLKRISKKRVNYFVFYATNLSKSSNIFQKFRYELKVKKINTKNVFRKKTLLNLTRTDSSSVDPIKITFKLDLSLFDKGTYKFTVKFTDLITKQHSTRNSVFNITE